jgi:preprotein translocase subunit SecE
MASKSKGQSAKTKKSGSRNISQEKKSSSFSPTAIRDFVNEVIVEFKKIVWPDKKVTFGLTGFVLVLVVVISLYLGSVDLILGKIVSSVLQ